MDVCSFRTGNNPREPVRGNKEVKGESKYEGSHVRYLSPGLT